MQHKLLVCHEFRKRCQSQLLNFFCNVILQNHDNLFRFGSTTYLLLSFSNNPLCTPQTPPIPSSSVIKRKARYNLN